MYTFTCTHTTPTHSHVHMYERTHPHTHTQAQRWSLVAVRCYAVSQCWVSTRHPVEGGVSLCMVTPTALTVHICREVLITVVLSEGKTPQLSLLLNLCVVHTQIVSGCSTVCSNMLPPQWPHPPSPSVTTTAPPLPPSHSAWKVQKCSLSHSECISTHCGGCSYVLFFICLGPR